MIMNAGRQQAGGNWDLRAPLGQARRSRKMSGGARAGAGIMPGVSDDLWWATPVLAGRLIRLEPLRLEHAPGYLAAAGTGEEGAEVFRWMSPPGGALAQPVTVEDATRRIADALAARARGARLPDPQIAPAPGQVAGTPP